MSTKVQADLIKELAGGTIFQLRYMNSKGKIRFINCRAGVKKAINPNTRGLTDKQKKVRKDNNLLTVADMKLVQEGKHPYKSLRCDRLLEVKVRGKHFKREKITDEWKELK